MNNIQKYNDLLLNRLSLIFLLSVISISNLLGQTTESTTVTEILDSRIYDVPKIHWEPSKDQGDIKGLFYTTIPFKGKETRVFAYLGIPKSDKKLPAMVLVHGGGGTAFHEWVKIWNDRGYAAIAMSLEGHMPNEEGKGKHRHEYSGPKRTGRFDDIEKPVKEQWMYRAVTDAILGHTLLASFPEVDANRIGITGISWGGIISSLISGVDTRFKCAMPVYGAGFLYNSKGHFGDHGDASEAFIEKKKFWDPSHQFKNGNIPTLWVNSDSDGHFSLNITSDSYKITSNHAYMSIHPGMAHGHLKGWDIKIVPELYAFADHILKAEGANLTQITEQPKGRRSVMTYASEKAITKASIYYLKEPLTYRRVEGEKHPKPGTWIVKEAKINQNKKSVKIKLPKDCKTYYVNLEDERGFISSSVLIEL